MQLQWIFMENLRFQEGLNDVMAFMAKVKG